MIISKYAQGCTVPLIRSLYKSKSCCSIFSSNLNCTDPRMLYQYVSIRINMSDRRWRSVLCQFCCWVMRTAETVGDKQNHMYQIYSRVILQNESCCLKDVVLCSIRKLLLLRIHAQWGLHFERFDIAIHSNSLQSHFMERKGSSATTLKGNNVCSEMSVRK